MDFKFATVEEAMQGAFRGAYRGLRHQQWIRSVCVKGVPALRGHSGRACAIGWLIPESSYDPELEAGSPLGAALHRMHPALASWRGNKRFRLFLDALRGAHDYSMGPNDMRERFERLRVERGWEVPS